MNMKYSQKEERQKESRNNIGSFPLTLRADFYPPRIKAFQIFSRCSKSFGGNVV